MAKRPSWFFNAAKRTLHTAVPSLAEPDDAWAATLLNEAELRLFLSLAAPEREHAVAVARCVEKAWTAAWPAAAPGLEYPRRETVLRAALLHDVGKLGSSNNVVWRVLTHLLPQSEAPAEPRLGGLAGVRQARRHHAAYGERLILAAGGDPEVARLVRAHHDDLASSGVAGRAAPTDGAALGSKSAAAGGSAPDPAGLIAACDELT